MNPKTNIIKLRESTGRNFMGWYGTSSTFTRLRHDLQRAAAWHCLTPTAKLIGVDFIDYFERTSAFDTDTDIHRRGVIYTYSMANVHISRSSFFSSMSQLKEKGFVKPHPKKKYQNGAAKIWVPAIKWKKYTPTDDELRSLDKYLRRRLRNVAGVIPSTLDYITNLEHLDPEAVANATGNGPLFDAVQEQVNTHERAERLRQKYHPGR